MPPGLEHPNYEEMELIGEFHLATTEDELWRDLHRDSYQELREKGLVGPGTNSCYEILPGRAIKLKISEPDGPVIATFYVVTDKAMKVARIYRQRPQEV